MELQTMRNSY